MLIFMFLVHTLVVLLHMFLRLKCIFHSLQMINSQLYSVIIINLVFSHVYSGLTCFHLKCIFCLHFLGYVPDLLLLT